MSPHQERQIIAPILPVSRVENGQHVQNLHRWTLLRSLGPCSRFQLDTLRVNHTIDVNTIGSVAAFPGLASEAPTALRCNGVRRIALGAFSVLIRTDKFGTHQLISTRSSASRLHAVVATQPGYRHAVTALRNTWIWISNRVEGARRKWAVFPSSTV